MGVFTMLRFSRNKLVSVLRESDDTLKIHGVLEDGIYGLEIDMLIRIDNLEILSVNGRWNRYTTPECPRAITALSKAAGLKIREGIEDKIHKIIGREGCRHFANLLIECCNSAKKAVLIARWDDAKRENLALTFKEFIERTGGSLPVISVTTAPSENQTVATTTTEKREIKENGLKDNIRDDSSRAKSFSGKTVIDLHVHTFPASPCSSASADQVIQKAKMIGLTGICFTDHNYVWKRHQIEDLRQKHGFLVLAGNEITTDQGDVLVFGFDRDIKGIIRLEELNREVKKAKGFIIAAHPFRGFLIVGPGQLGLTLEKAMARKLFKFVDAIEVLNGKVTEKENNFALEVAQALKLPCTGGSDAHEIDEVGCYATCFDDEIETEIDLLHALKSGNFYPVIFKKSKIVNTTG